MIEKLYQGCGHKRGAKRYQHFPHYVWATSKEESIKKLKKNVSKYFTITAVRLVKMEGKPVTRRR